MTQPVSLRGLLILSALLFGCEPSGPGVDPPFREDGGRSDGGRADGGSSDGGGTPTGWSVIDLPNDGERVTGIHCDSASECVVSAGGLGISHLYATDARTITATLLTGDTDLGDRVGVLGEPDFNGFSRVGGRLIALLDNGGYGFVSATSDITNPASWTVVSLGTVSTGDFDFALNTQYGFGSDGTGWTQLRSAFVYRTTTAPGPTASWEVTWTPRATPPIPSDIVARRAADPTLCDSDPGYSDSPRPTGAAYVAPDLGIILSPAHTLNQSSSDATGICISTDEGASFHLAPFTEVADLLGPIAMTCTSSDHCVAMGGQMFVADSTYAYVSRNASLGSGSTWTRATLPTFSNTTLPRAIVFAPDALHGWAMGEDDREGFLWATTDGGNTWTDVTSQIRGLSTGRLWAGFALDGTHLMVGGESSTLLVLR